MTLATMSLKLYTDVGLTTLYGGTSSLVHYTNQSDNPQDFKLWLGSTTSGVQFTAVSSPGVDQITITPTAILPIFVISTAYTSGQAVHPVTPNGFRYECTTAGTSGGSEPVWPVTPVGATVVSGTATFTLRGAVHPITEVKLAITNGGLAGATAGAALNLGVSITGGVAGAKEIDMRVTNSVIIVSDNTATPELSMYINNIQERSV